VGSKPGTRLRSSVCDTEVVVVKAPDADLDLRCGGHPMVAIDEERRQGLTVEPGFDAGSLIGKRYTDQSGELEVLCTKAGASALSLGDDVLELKDAKPLPSSD
jgi:hypothetical protein